MAFNWKRFLNQHRIQFVTSGPNVGRNNINIRCPFCGQADPSEHMGLNPAGWWGCLRNRAHRGRTPEYLIRRLLNCSEDEAGRIVKGEGGVAPTGSDLSASFAKLKQKVGAKEEAYDRPLVLMREFKPLLSGSVFARPFVEYLRQRGYRDNQIEWLAKNYDLRYATEGPYAGRIIIPIYDRYGNLLSWSGRTIRKDAIPRYKTLSVTPDLRDPNAPVAKIPANATILGLPVLWRAENLRYLILMEGQFDAFKVSAYGHTFGVYGTCLFGLNVYPTQLSELLELSARYDELCALLDEDAELHRLRIKSGVKPLSCRMLKMPPGSDDPGSMSPQQVVEFCMRLGG